MYNIKNDQSYKNSLEVNTNIDCNVGKFCVNAQQTVLDYQSIEGNIVRTTLLPFSLFMLGLVRNQERDEANMAATQNSPPLDLLGEIWGGGFALLLEEKTKRRKALQQTTDECWQCKNTQMSLCTELKNRETRGGRNIFKFRI